MSVSLRPAAASDFESVTRLLAELGRPAPTPETAPAMQEVYLRWIVRPETAPFVAEQEGQVVGFMSLEFRSRLNLTRPEAWIPDLIVTEATRSTGTGKALLHRAFALARERGCNRVILESGFARKVAHSFYPSQGMTQSGYFYTLYL